MQKKKIWAIGDLHLAISVPEKDMAVFGPSWKNYMEKIKKNWEETIKEEDLVLIPGDITWATHISDAKKDLLWIDDLPGTKVMIKGNHDYWWQSRKKVESILPPSIHVIQNDHFDFDGISIGGTRLWDVPGLAFDSIIEYVPNPLEKKLLEKEEKKDLEKEKIIYERELQRLEMSLQSLNPSAKIRIAMTHYPPIGLDLEPTKVSLLLQKYKIDLCVFGHLHSVKKDFSFFGEKEGVRYILTSCDYLNFSPLCIQEF